MSPADSVVEQRLQRQQRSSRRLEQRVRRVDVDEFDPEGPDRVDRGGAACLGGRSSIGFDLQTVLVVAERDRLIRSLPAPGGRP